MNLKRFALPLFAGFTLFLSSCNSDETTDTTTTDTDSTNNTVTTPETVNTIVTTPQGMMVARHRVKDFAKWKVSYDEHDSMRLANGIYNYVVGRGVEDTSMVLVAVKVDDMAKAKAFAKDPSLKKAMQKGGVTGAPMMNFVTVVWRDTAIISLPIRSQTTFTVKDFNAWLTAFQSHRQERADNGVIDRSIGHDADNDKKVRLIVAISDTAKARAYWTSDLLKQRRNESGVTSTPERFIYTVVQRYR